MRITQTNNPAVSDRAAQGIRDIAAKVFQVSAAISLLLTVWLVFGLLSGRLGDTKGLSHADHQHIIDLVGSISNYLNIASLVAVISGVIAYWDVDALAYAFVGIAAFLAYGIQFVIGALQGQGGDDLVHGLAATATLNELHNLAVVLGAPGVLLLIVHIVARIRDRIYNTDLTAVTYGKDVKQEDNPRPLIGAAAKCWQLPFCRAGIRKQCPIYHARTKCWKERVGCMCEENIILLAMGGGQAPAEGLNTQNEQGFVPIGDLITKNVSQTRAQIPTRVGPRGVKIPTNPHLTEAQKRERCRNCVIYNEHQRQKYQLLSVPVTVLVPALVYINFDTVRTWVQTAMQGLDKVVGAITFQKVDWHPNLGAQFSSLPIETLIVICLTLVAITWAHRFLEYCTFKIKI